MIRLFFALFFIMIAPAYAENIIVPPFEQMDRSCVTAADCAVKNVGSCCGIDPQCVNVEQLVDPEGVAMHCTDSHLMGICAFTPLSGCTCVEGQCVGIAEESSISE
jgi:hypothetical protein